MVTLRQLPSPLTQISQSFAGDLLYATLSTSWVFRFTGSLNQAGPSVLSVLAEILADTLIIST